MDLYNILTDPSWTGIGAITGIIGTVVAIIAFKKRNSYKIDSDLSHSKFNNLQSISYSQTSAYDMAIIIKRYDYHFYKAKTIYSVILAITLMIFTSWHMINLNESIVNGYEKYLQGEKPKGNQEKIKYENFVNSGIKNKEALTIERNQMTLIVNFIVIMIYYLLLRPFILERICISLHNKTKYVSERPDFKVFSKDINLYLKNYHFMNKEVIGILINNFTRITKECYIHNVVS